MLIFESDVSQHKYTGLWSCKLKGDSSVTFTPGAKAILTNVALGAHIDFDERLNQTTLSFCRIVEDSEEDDPFVAICSFLPGRLENYATSVPLSADESYVLKVSGPNPIDVVGFFYNPREGQSFDQAMGQGSREDDMDNNRDPKENKRKKPKTVTHDVTSQPRQKTGNNTPNNTPTKDKKRRNEDRQQEHHQGRSHSRKDRSGDEPKPKRSRNDSPSKSHSKVVFQNLAPKDS